MANKGKGRWVEHPLNQGRRVIARRMAQITGRPWDDDLLPPIWVEDDDEQDRGGRPIDSTTERAIKLLTSYPTLRGKAAIAKLHVLDPVSFPPSMTTDDDNNLWRRVRRAQLRRRIP